MAYMDERRTHVTVEFRAKRLGMYLEPADMEAMRGAVVRRFEMVDGVPGEAEVSGNIRPGFTITAINDSQLATAPFQSVISALVGASRPVRITFRDPEVMEFRDRYGFIRTKLHVDKESAYFAGVRGSSERHDKEWLDFLCELGAGKGTSFGVARLARDACGEVVFPVEPSVRLNAMSPIHGRMAGISSSGAAAPATSAVSTKAPSTPSATGSGSGTPTASTGSGSSSIASMLTGGRAGKRDIVYQTSSSSSASASSSSATAASSGTAAAAPAAGAASAGGGGASDSTAAGPTTTGDAGHLSPTAPSHQPVIDIYKRCWSPASGIGVPQPPGLLVTLPGEVPRGKAKEKLVETLRRLVLYDGGIPAAFRPAVWYELSGAHAKAALHPPGYFAELCKMRPSPDAAYAIAKDLDRTYPGHPFFESRSGIASLQRVLSAFAVHNPEIGYAQSLNFVAGFLLLLLPEEHAFWVLEVMVNELIPPAYYDNALMGVHGDQRVLAHLVEELIPDVSDALTKAGIQLQVVTLEWFMCALCSVLPAHTALRVWDAMFIYGLEAIFRVVLALFHANRSRILSVAVSSTQSKVTVSAAATAGGPAASPAAGGSAAGGYAGEELDEVAATAQRVLAAAAAANAAALALPSGAPPAPPAGEPLHRSSSASSTGSVSSVASGGGFSIHTPGRSSFSGGSGGGAGTAPGTPAAAAGLISPVMRGGTVRHPASTFPALYAMLKALPSTAFDPDDLMRRAFPPAGAAASGAAASIKGAAKGVDPPLPFETHVSPARIAKLRAAARAVVQAEYAETLALRARSTGSSGPASPVIRRPSAAVAATPAAASDTATAVGAAAGAAASSVDAPPVEEAAAAVADAVDAAPVAAAVAGADEAAGEEYTI